MEFWECLGRRVKEDIGGWTKLEQIWKQTRAAS